MTVDRRRHQRYDYHLEVEYSPKGDGVIYSKSISRNISKSGICIPVLSRLVRTDDPILLEIYPGGKIGYPVKVRGRVVWVRENASMSDCLTADAEAGIEFAEAAPQGLDKLLIKS